MEGRVRLRCHARIVQAATGKPVTQGYTIHAITNDLGRPTRPPAWFLDLFKPVLP
jgi:acyl-CoA thioesterase FadM